MTFTINNKNYTFNSANILRFQGRDVILVECEDDWKQGFYRSSGRNSGKAGRWFPFDGYLAGIHWFDKGRFCIYNQKYTELERYGYQILKDIGDYLTISEIGEGREVDYYEINKLVAQSNQDILKQPFAPYWLKMSTKELQELATKCTDISQK